MKLRRSWDVTVLIHEPYERILMRFLPGIRTVEYECDEQFMAHYRNADIVVTGRLHGALPAIRYGTRLVFYGDPTDTRLSLLSFLGIPIRRLSTDLADVLNLPEVKTPSRATLERVFELREAFLAYAKEYGIPTRLQI